MGTTSTTRRQSYVLAMPAAGHKQLLTRFKGLSRGDYLRGACVMCACVLSFAGCLAPHVDAHVLAALLFFAAAVAMLLAVTFVAAEAPAPSSQKSSEAPRPAIHRVLEQRPATLHDLVPVAVAASASSLAQWQCLTHRMSHELRTPLNAVLGFSELMSSEVFGPLGSPQYAEYARNINASGRTLLKSAEDALAITNLLTGLNGPSRPVASVQAALDDMTTFHAPEIDRDGIKLTARLDHDCEIVGEPQTLRQIMINLLGEALERADLHAHVAVTCSAEQDEVRLIITLDRARACALDREPSFSLMLARTLSQLSHARMDESASEDQWSTTVVFTRATQRDFFAA